MTQREKKIIYVKEKIMKFRRDIDNFKKYIDIQDVKKRLKQFKEEIKSTRKTISKNNSGKNENTHKIGKEKGKKPIKKQNQGWKKNLKIRLMNINGLRTDKYIDIEEQFYRKEEEINIVCLTETHEKCEKTDVDRNIRAYNAIREKKAGEKKGGGIQVLIPRMSRIKLKEVVNTNKELLELEGTMFGIGIKLIIVYFDANKNQKGKDRNVILKEIIERKIERNRKEGLIVMGDFNGHIKSIDGRDTDKNGKMILEWMENYELILLNMDEKCEGVFTRIRGEQKTTIDYVMVNRKIYENYESMHIDEDKMIIDGSDHNLITVNLKIKEKNALKKAKWKTNSFYTTKTEEVKEYIKDLGDMWEDGEEKDLQERLDDMGKKAEISLKRTARRKVGGEEDNKVAEKVWMNDEIRGEIEKRRVLNRKKRYGRSENESQQLEKNWRQQKSKVQRLIREEKGKYEMEITRRIKEKGNRGKDMWKDINRLSGRDVKEKDILEVYENDKKLEDKEAEERVDKQWKGQFKDGKRELTPIHSGVWRREKIQETIDMYRREDEEKERRGEERWIIHEKLKFDGVMWEEERKKLKAGKAAGPDMIKNEIFIAMENDERCKKGMIQSYEGIMSKENIPDSWNHSRIKLIPKPVSKKKKRTEKDFRPVALTPTSYRIMMSAVRKDVENI